MTAENRLEGLRLAVSIQNATGFMTTEQTVARADAFATFLSAGVPEDTTTVSDEPL